MKRKRNQIGALTLAIVAALFFALPMRAQVTIGSEQVPEKNALLDLRENTTDSLSKKGLLLPRVELSSTTATTPLDTHVKGMFVYNTATTGDVKPGIYYNDGSKWVAAAGGQTTPAATGNFNYVDATSSYTMTADDGFIRAVYPAGATNGSITITFPANVPAGRVVYIANMSGDDNMLVLTSPTTKDSQIPGVFTGMIGTYVYLGTQGWYLVAMFSLAGLG